MHEQFEEARSIRRKNRKGGESPIGEAERFASERARLEQEICETTTAINYAQSEAEKYNVKIKEIKENLKNVLYNANLGSEEKASKITSLKSKQENCEFVLKQAVARWAKLTDKKKALEKALKELNSSK